MSLIGDSSRFLLRRQQVAICGLVAVFVVSAIAVAHAAFETRRLYGLLQVQQDAQDELDSEFERLLLEQGAWANYARVDEVSRRELAMRNPRAADVVVVSR
jgi:cell division protein FtsL